MKDYTITDWILGKMFSLVERLTHHKEKEVAIEDQRDIVWVPFGMGLGRVPVTMNQYEDRELIDLIFQRMNKIAGFDPQEYEQEARFGSLHDGCCWAVADDLYHTIRLLNEFRQRPSFNLLDRLQVMPHSAGIFFTSWLTGMASLQEMLILTHECSKIMYETEQAAATKEINDWYFSGASFSPEKQDCLQKLRAKVDPSSQLSPEELADQLHGRIEFLFSPTAHMLEEFISDVQKQGIGMDVGIRMSPHCVIFTGSALELERFSRLFTGARKIALRRNVLQVQGSPHGPRFNPSGAQTKALLQSYKNRLREPVVPFINWRGEWAQTKEDFIDAAAGNSNQLISFDKMIERAFSHGGKHFLLIQTGTHTVAGDFFDGIIRSHIPNPNSIHVHKSVIKGKEHPLLPFLSEHPQKTHGPCSLDETVEWYEDQLEKRRASISKPLN
jgi:hypothetical protein